MTWKSYQEDMPYPGFTGLSWANHVRRHNPLIDFTDTCAPSQKYNSVPYTQLAKDITNNNTPNYAYITPNLQHDAHDGTRTQADAWLALGQRHSLHRQSLQFIGVQRLRRARRHSGDRSQGQTSLQVQCSLPS